MKKKKEFRKKTADVKQMDELFAMEHDSESNAKLGRKKVVLDSWYHNIVDHNGNADNNACQLLGHICYFYRSSEKGERKFWDDVLRLPYKEVHRDLNLSEYQIKKALTKLEDMGLISREKKRLNPATMTFYLYIRVHMEKIRFVSVTHSNRLTKARIIQLEKGQAEVHFSRNVSILTFRDGSILTLPKVSILTSPKVSFLTLPNGSILPNNHRVPNHRVPDHKVPDHRVPEEVVVSSQSSLKDSSSENNKGEDYHNEEKASLPDYGPENKTSVKDSDSNKNALPSYGPDEDTTVKNSTHNKNDSSSYGPNTYSTAKNSTQDISLHYGPEDKQKVQTADLPFSKRSRTDQVAKIMGFIGLKNNPNWTNAVEERITDFIEHELLDSDTNKRIDLDPIKDNIVSIIMYSLKRKGCDKDLVAGSIIKSLRKQVCNTARREEKIKRNLEAKAEIKGNYMQNVLKQQLEKIDEQIEDIRLWEQYFVDPTRCSAGHKARIKKLRPWRDDIVPGNIFSRAIAVVKNPGSMIVAFEGCRIKSSFRISTIPEKIREMDVDHECLEAIFNHYGLSMEDINEENFNEQRMSNIFKENMKKVERAHEIKREEYLAKQKKEKQNAIELKSESEMEEEKVQFEAEDDDDEFLKALEEDEDNEDDDFDEFLKALEEEDDEEELKLELEEKRTVMDCIDEMGEDEISPGVVKSIHLNIGS